MRSIVLLVILASALAAAACYSPAAPSPAEKPAADNAIVVWGS
jgi:hypothetical protein